MNTIVKFMYIIQIIMYLLSYLKSVHIPLVVILSFNLIVLILYFLFTKKKAIYNRRVIILMFLFLIVFGFYPIIFANEILFNEIISNTFKNIVFILNIYLIALYIYANHEEEFFLKSSFYCIGLFVTLCYVINFDNFNGITSLKLIFDKELRYRECFGIYHANAAGSLCLIIVILYNFIKKYKNKDRLNFVIVLAALLMLLSTASRSSLTALMIFYIGKAIYRNNIKSKLKYNNKIKICTLFIIIMIVVMNVFNKLNISDLIIATNRMSNFTINIPELFRNKKDLFGFGFVNPGDYFKSWFPYNTTYVDNYFLYIYLSLGLIGSILFFGLCIYLYNCIISTRKNTYIDKSTIVLTFIVHIYCSMFESCFFTPQLIISYIFGIVYFQFISFKAVYKKELVSSIGGKVN